MRREGRGGEEVVDSWCNTILLLSQFGFFMISAVIFLRVVV